MLLSDWLGLTIGKLALHCEVYSVTQLRYHQQSPPQCDFQDLSERSLVHTGVATTFTRCSCSSQKSSSLMMKVRYINHRNHWGCI